jgi:hypothetical protein
MGGGSNRSPSAGGSCSRRSSDGRRSLLVPLCHLLLLVRGVCSTFLVGAVESNHGLKGRFNVLPPQSDCLGLARAAFGSIGVEVRVDRLSRGGKGGQGEPEGIWVEHGSRRG